MQDRKLNDAFHLVHRISKETKGLISFTAKHTLIHGGRVDFLKELHQQLTLDDPDCTLKKLGEDISSELIKFFEP